MLFNSFDFLVFFAIVLIVYSVIPRKLRAIWLLIASYYFYMGWNAKYALLIGGSTLLTYLCGLIMNHYDTRATESSAESATSSHTESATSSHTESATNSHAESLTKKKKIALAACIIINLGVLAIFKYDKFLADSLNAVLGVLHLTSVPRGFDFLLPVGISFYTFQAIGYVIDVYRGDIKAERNFIRYALFVSFFPQLVAGPIERSKNLLTQVNNIENIKIFNAKRMTSGAILAIWGLFMKMVLADRISIFVDNVFDNYQIYGSVELFLAISLFTIQIYCDFAGYSMVAIGTAKIMGFELMENFAAPFLARTTGEQWNRWHISLNTWFKDYLYFPLGGSRKGKFRKYLNLFIIFVVSGLWHGADWSFVMWGVVSALYRIISELTAKPRKRLLERLSVNTECGSWHFLETVVTYLLFVFGTIFFRSDSVTDAFIFIRRLFTKPTPWVLFDGSLYNLGLDRVEMNIMIFAIILLTLVDMIRYFKNQTLDQFLFSQNVWFEWFVIVGLIVMILVYGQYGPAFDAQQFIYFQF